MKKGQQRFWTALFGLIAAAAGGWAVHITLSYQDNANTASNGGVVVRDIQSSQVTHTGSRDIVTGTQHKGQGDILPGTQIRDAGSEHTIIIGITLEQYLADLKEREQEITERMKQAQAKERRVLEKEKSEIEHRLADTASGYQAHIKELEERIARLKTFRGQVPDSLLDQARAALAQGSLSKADNFLAEIEGRTVAAIQAAAEAAYLRSRIARDEIRYRNAYEHAQRAARLAPENSRYLSGAGELAQILGNYTAAKDYHEQALAIDLKTHGENHSDVAIRRNNLGSAWQALGEYQKAIDYYEQALANALKTYGEDHPDVAIRRNNLGLAWQSLGEYQKAIGYYEQALASDFKTLGEDHPHVAASRNNLGSVWQALGEYEKAIGYFEQALASDLKTYGEDHPAVATDRNNLGAAWQNLGEYRKAIGYLKQALAGNLETYGEDHPAVARDCNNLGLAWQALGEYEKAIGYLEQALVVFEREHGPEHSRTKIARDHLAAARVKQEGAAAAGGP